MAQEPASKQRGEAMNPFSQDFKDWFQEKYGHQPDPNDRRHHELSDAFEAGWETAINANFDEPDE
jgi:hypothetical protein